MRHLVNVTAAVAASAMLIAPSSSIAAPAQPAAFSFEAGNWRLVGTYDAFEQRMKCQATLIVRQGSVGATLDEFTVEIGPFDTVSYPAFRIDGGPLIERYGLDGSLEAPMTKAIWASGNVPIYAPTLVDAAQIEVRPAAGATVVLLNTDGLRAVLRRAVAEKCHWWWNPDRPG